MSLLPFVQVHASPAWWDVRIQSPEGTHKVCRALTAVKKKRKNDFESVSKTEPLLNDMCP